MGREGIVVRKSKKGWLNQSGPHFLSCAVICESLGINLARLRRFLREWHLRMRTGHDAPRLARRSPASADAHIIPPDVSRTLRAPAKSSLTSPGREVRERPWSRNVRLGCASNTR